MNLVVDANVAVKWFVEENLREEALNLLGRHDPLLAPDIIVSEVTNIAWKKAIRGDIDKTQAYEIAKAIHESPLNLRLSVGLNEQALRIALELNHPIYDCLYLACAEVTNGLLITADKRLYKAVQHTEFESFVQDLGETDFQIDVLPPLNIPLSKVHRVIELARSDAETRLNMDDALWGKDDPEKGAQFRPAHLSGAAWSSVPRRRLAAYLESCSPEERAELQALMWLGRGYEEDRIEWPKLLGRAHGAGITDTDILYMLGLADCLEAGLVYFRKTVKPEADG